MIKNIRLRLSSLFIAVVLLSACSQQAEFNADIAIENVTVVDGVNGVRENQTVLISGDEIIAVQANSEPVSAEQRIDGSGQFLIPGLWDFHVHLTYDERFAETMPALFLSYGITSVRDTGGLMNKILPVVETLRAPDAIGPRVFFAGPLLDGNFVVYDGDSRPEIGVQNSTHEQASKRIAEMKSQGVDFIKIYELVSPEVFAAMVDAALEHELPIDSHVPLSMLARDAGSKVNSIEHLRNIELDCAANAEELHLARLETLENVENRAGFDLRSYLHSSQRLPAIANYDEARCDQTIAALINTMQVPTLRLNAQSAHPPYQRPGWQEALNRSPASVRTAWQQAATDSLNNNNNVDTRFADWSLFLTQRMHERGVPIAAGTDTPIGLSVPGYSLHSELELLEKAGLSAMEVLQAATLRPAEYFSLEQQMGSIEPGKKADMVLLSADPLESISNTKAITVVVSKGKAWKLEELIKLLQ